MRISQQSPFHRADCGCTRCAPTAGWSRGRTRLFIGLAGLVAWLLISVLAAWFVR